MSTAATEITQETTTMPRTATLAVPGPAAGVGVAAPAVPRWDGTPVVLDATKLAAEKGKVTAGGTPSAAHAINRFLHVDVPAHQIGAVRIEHPGGAHNLAVGVDYPVDVQILGHAGYYLGGMNKQASITVHGNVERGVGENMMSGTVRVTGNASECAGATARGGLLIIQGDAAGRCGISLKGGDIVVGGSVGHAAMFMAQAGRLLVCGDAGPGLGDSLYEAVIYVAGTVEGLGADAHQQPMTDADHAAVAELLQQARLSSHSSSWKKVVSAKTLYHWNSANRSAY